MEKKGKSEEASKLFYQAWNEATNDFEKFISAHYVARHQKNVSEKLQWLEIDLQLALQINDDAVQSAFPLLYSNIAKCYEELGNVDDARKNYTLAASFDDTPSDKGPFYHGTKADLQAGDFLTAGGRSNYNPEVLMNHIYFTALVNGAGLAAAMAKGNGNEHVYMVEPTGSFENDPNVTNSYFPGNPTRSYRTTSQLKVVREISDWSKQTPEELKKWRKRVDDNKGEIIN